MLSQESFCRQIRRICLNWYDSSCVAATAWLVAYLPSRAAATPTPALFHTHSPMIICWIWFLPSFCLVTCKLQDGRPTPVLWSFCPVCCLFGLFVSLITNRTYMQGPPCSCLSLVAKGSKYSQPISEHCDNLEKSRPTSCVYCLLAIGDSWRRGALSRHCSWCLFIVLRLERPCNVQFIGVQIWLSCRCSRKLSMVEGRFLKWWSVKKGVLNLFLSIYR